MTKLLSGRNFTLYQRAVLINSLILSKVWYVAHTYPLLKKHSNFINKEIFEYLWQSKLNPIKRDVVYQDKTKGGLGVLNVFIKSQSIIASTFLKQFLASQENNSFLKYFCAIRINPIFNIRELPENVCYISPWYFNEIIVNIRKCLHMKHFPCIKAADMYKFLLPDSKPAVQDKHSLNWEKIWPRTTFKYVNLHERDVHFKYLHGILPTKLRLFQMKQINCQMCPNCNIVEDNNHMFLKCKKVKQISDYFKIILSNVCTIEHVNLESMLYLDLKLKTKRQLNTAIILIVHYISTIWYNRGRNVEVDPTLFKARVLNHQRILSLILKDKLKHVFTEKYCNINSLI